MKKIRHGILLILAIFGLAVAPLATSDAAKVDIYTANTKNQEAACESQGGKVNSSGECDETVNSLSSIIQTVANILLFLVGAVAVIMLIIGGFRYVTSNGDAAAIKGAKDTILYAIIGIIVAFLAYAAVNFVVTSLNG